MAKPTDPVPGVNLWGYLRTESGVGEHARTLLAALDEARVPVAPIDFPDSRSRRGHPLPLGARDEPCFDLHLICVDADQTPHFVERVGAGRLAGHRIGYWHWEVEEFPDGMARSADARRRDLDCEPPLGRGDPQEGREAGVRDAPRGRSAAARAGARGRAAARRRSALPHLFRLRQRHRAQEPGGRARRLPPRLPRRRRAAADQERQRPPPPRAPRRARRRGRRPRRRPRRRPLPRARRAGGPDRRLRTSSSRSTAPRASG